MVITVKVETCHLVYHFPIYSNVLDCETAEIVYKYYIPFWATVKTISTKVLTVLTVAHKGMIDILFLPNSYCKGTVAK